MEELNCKVVFTIPVGKGLPIYESVVVTWIVMAILVLLSIILVRNLKVEKHTLYDDDRPLYWTF